MVICLLLEEVQAEESDQPGIRLKLNRADPNRQEVLREGLNHNYGGLQIHSHILHVRHHNETYLYQDSCHHQSMPKEKLKVFQIHTPP